ncbi:MAG: hypothetical protein Unbinned5081contig1000_58 [Prokaryotic dsDNA virus sp.]|nr:MAG: hypothetical protein Unbinned5081contig1000_58 [Prokaryotic dsDNA virus sp.]
MYISLLKSATLPLGVYLVALAMANPGTNSLLAIGGGVSLGLFCSLISHKE